MLSKIFDIELNTLHKGQRTTDIHVNQGDTRSVVFNFRVFEGAAEINYADIGEAVIVFTKPDRPVFQASASKQPHGFTCALEQNALAAPGRVVADMIFYGHDSERITALSFTFWVDRDPISDEVIESSTEFDALQRAKQLLDELTELFESFPITDHASLTNLGFYESKHKGFASEAMLLEALNSVPAEGLRIPVRIELESDLPEPETLTRDNVGDFYTIQTMDITAAGRTGKAWVNFQDSNTANPIVIYKTYDQYYSADGESIVLTPTGQLSVNSDWLGGVLASREDLRLTTERWRGFDTSGGSWICIRTNIPANIATHIVCSLRGFILDGSQIIDTLICFHVTAAGLVTATSTNILNNGLPLSGIRAFNDTDNTWSIAIATRDRRHRLLVEVFANVESNHFMTRTQSNRVVDITQPTTVIPTGENMLQFDPVRMRNYGVVSDRTVTVFVATENGDDIMRGNSRDNSVRTVMQAMRMAGAHSNNVVLTINRTTTAQPPAWAAATAFGLNDRCTTGGYVWRSLVANNTGNTPGLTSTQWTFDNHVSHPGTNNRGTFSNTGVYEVGDFVLSPAGVRSITYICMRPVTSNQDAHMRPSGTLDANLCWAPISSGNAVVQWSAPGVTNVNTTVSNCSGLHLNQTEDLFVIYLASLILTNNQRLIVDQRIHVGNSLLLDYNGSVRIARAATSMLAQSVLCGTVSHQATLRCSRIIAAGVGKFYVRGIVHVTPDLPTRSAIDIDGTDAYFDSAVNIIGNNRGFNTAPAANTGHGIQVRRGGRVTLGQDNNPCTISGIGGNAFSVQAGCEMDIRVRSVVINRDAPADAGMAAQPAIGTCFNVARSAVLRLHRNLATITRNGAADVIAAEAEVWDARNPAYWAVRGIRP